MVAYDKPETVLQEAYNSAFVGLRNTRIFTVSNENKGKLLDYLNGNGVRSISMETGKGLRISVLTTGIQTDRPFNKEQI